MSKKILLSKLLKTSKSTIIDLRPFQNGKRMLKNSIWIGPQAYKGYLELINIDKSQTYHLLYGGHQESQKNEIIQKFQTLGYFNIEDIIQESDIDHQDDSIETYVPDICHKISDQKSSIILDVRSQYQWKRYGYIVAQNVIKIEFENFFVDALKLDKTKCYVPHCKAGYRAFIAYTYLKNNDYNAKVYNKRFQDILKEQELNFSR